jgi:formylglycine-generating enzyme required for sulfatase activity
LLFGLFKNKDIKNDNIPKKEIPIVSIEEKKKPSNFVNSIGMEFIWIEGGSFLMGKNSNYTDGSETELPSHEVHLNGFWIAKYPVTQEEYYKLTRTNPSYFKNDKVIDSRRHPVEQVSWFDANSYIELLNRYEGRINIYALPTEAQWEYVAKAGDNYRFTFGDSEALLDEYARYVLNSQGKTSLVDAKKPNPLGLYSIVGNVWEWCEDDFIGNYNTTPTDGSAYKGDTRFEYFKIRRGGSFKSDYMTLRSTFRGYSHPDKNANDIGFRIVMNVNENLI